MFALRGNGFGIRRTAAAECQEQQSVETAPPPADESLSAEPQRLIDSAATERSRVARGDRSDCGSSTDGILSRSLEGLVTSANRAAEGMYGYTSTEAIGRPMDDIILPEDRDHPRGILARVGGGQQIPPYEPDHVRRDGSRLPVSVSFSPL
jgi:PAS domain S-box-containing protein